VLFEQLSLLDTGNFYCGQRRLAAQGCVRQLLAVEPGATMQRRFLLFAGPQVVALQSLPGPPVEAFEHALDLWRLWGSQAVDLRPVQSRSIRAHPHVKDDLLAIITYDVQGVGQHRRKILGIFNKTRPRTRAGGDGAVVGRR